MARPTRHKAPVKAPSPTGEETPVAPETGEPPSTLLSLKIRRRVMASKMRAPSAVAADGAAARPAPGTAGTVSSATGGAPPRAVPDHSPDMVAYWSQLRGQRSLPAKNEIDPDHVARQWPSSILMRRRAGSQSLEAVRIYGGEAPSASDAPEADTRGGVSLSPLMLQWLLALAKEVVREGRPMTDTESFPGAKATVRYRAVGLPFSDNGEIVDHVLCHVAAER